MPVFRVPDMTYSGCLRPVTSAVQDIDAAAVVEADLETKQVRVTSTASPEALAASV